MAVCTDDELAILFARVTPRARRVECHGLSWLDAAGGRLLQPGDAQAEPLEAGGVRRAIASMQHRPTTSARSDRPKSTDRVIGMRGKECGEVAAHGRSGAIAFEAAPRLSM